MRRHVLAIADLADEEIEEIFRRAEEMEAALAARAVPRLADGAIMATLFYEPSTRTRLSFETAMWRLGGAVISAAEMKSSSATKGETLADTAKVVSSYADLLVLRHIWDGAARVAAEHADVPVINAGDGSHEHPTQTLCDLYTLRRAKGTLQGLTVAIGGDLKRGRTVHSLVRALARFKVNIVIVPAPGMELPEWFLRRLAEESGYRPRIARPDDLRALAGDVHALYLAPAKPHQLTLFTDTEFDLEHGLAEAEPITLDALYMTRPQRERQDPAAEDAAGYLRVDTATFQDPSLRHTLLMHPLPRTGEISSALDRDPRSVYFRQAAYGVPVRMALVSFLLGERAAPAAARVRPDAERAAAPRVAARCANPNCITRREEVIVERRFQVHREPGGGAHLVCTYCDHETGLEIIGNRKSRHYNVFSEPMHGYLESWLRDDALVIFDSVKQAEEAGYRPYKLGPQKAIMSATEIAESIAGLTRAVVAETPELKDLVIVGVRTAGAFIARRIADRIQAERGATIDVGVVDVHGGREGIERWLTGGVADPIVVDDRVVVLVDDVINTGWTAKDALAIIWRAGRPRAARLAVLIDRGHRQLPIKPTYVGKHLPTAPHERVRVRLRELDREHRDTVVIYSYLDPKVAA